MELVTGLAIPFVGTTLGSAMVFSIVSKASGTPEDSAASFKPVKSICRPSSATVLKSLTLYPKSVKNWET